MLLLLGNNCCVTSWLRLQGVVAVAEQQQATFADISTTRTTTTYLFLSVVALVLYWESCSPKAQKLLDHYLQQNFTFYLKTYSPPCLYFYLKIKADKNEARYPFYNILTSTPNILNYKKQPKGLSFRVFLVR
jgi:hypothetical protein